MLTRCCDTVRHAACPVKRGTFLSYIIKGLSIFVLSFFLIQPLLAAGRQAAPAIPQKATDDPLVRIDTDYHRGVLSRDQWAIYTLKAIREPRQLPDEYQFPVINRRAATPAILEVLDSWDELSPSAQYTASQLLSRPSAAFSYVSPSGFFRLHYDTLGANAVSPFDGDSDGIPDYVERIAAYMDTSLN
ncbi:MAG: hypothetical protein D6800_05935, partial [Candidatus Zixiibacteriota bacterium]